jgi:ribonuclease BN (tRNA processing enzyme)
MKLLMIGTGNAFSAERFGCSAIIEGPAGQVMVDCPDSFPMALRNAERRSGWKIDQLAITDLIVTHLHGDHCNGLESLGFLRWLHHRETGSPLPRLHVWRPVADRLWERLAPAMDQSGAAKLSDYFKIHHLNPDRESIIAGMEVTCRGTQHPIPTSALKFRAGGKVIAWSSDTPFDPQLIDWLSKDANLVIHETSPPPTHTPIEMLNSLPPHIKSKMRLMHWTDDFDPSSTTIACMREGEVLSI